jgi:ethanolaminephosphotransferase
MRFEGMAEANTTDAYANPESDFVYSVDSAFTFTQRCVYSLIAIFQLLTLDSSLIADGSAMAFTAHATSPTITMPRIKAITTGSIPSFLDVILNFAESDTSSTLATQDTWLAQMKAKKTGQMVMYGDDTWLKLFPETFDRADGTSSFFVAVSHTNRVKSLELAEIYFDRILQKLTIM